ncbi:stage II sporulation protein M [Candidatus Formimonas warabiya]|uniref:Stage II sporulation protein M n=1 Tax=Formimonas warabiya TaxID=1761012 RepID=A0A3G1KSD5_FORW1|nr:stage II sporulation protein M [Candidatus Formimonas warabiya]ATW25371.1 hypothetical protein DCMF_11860 [Candidatus Formimonas warabiya]
MNSEQFVSEHRSEWERLEKILTKLGKKEKSLTKEELRDVAPLYRRAVSHLAQAQAWFPQSKLVIYLNNLVTQAQAKLYGKRGVEARSVWRFFRQGFPRLFRENRIWIAASAAFLLIGFIFGILLYQIDLSLCREILPMDIQTVAEGVKNDQPRNLLAPGEKPLMSSVIMINNIKVAALAFALGILFGIGTVFLLLYNGLIIGVLAALFTEYQQGTIFWSLILPHGVMELTAIILAGAGGLLVAGAVVRPGDLARVEALKIKGKQAFLLLAGVVPLFIATAAIEGFFTPLPLPPVGKLAFSVLTLLGLVIYFHQGRHDPEKRSTDDAGRNRRASEDYQSR